MTYLPAPPSIPQSGKTELDTSPAIDARLRALIDGASDRQLGRLLADIAAAPEGPDLVGLREVLASGERAHAQGKLDMTYWIDPQCGTVGCLIGTFCRDHPDDALKMIVCSGFCPMVPEFNGKHSFFAIAARFRIESTQACELFSSITSDGSDRPSLTALEELDQFITDREPAPAPRLADLSEKDYAAAEEEAEEYEYERFDMCS